MWGARSLRRLGRRRRGRGPRIGRRRGAARSRLYICILKLVHLLDLSVQLREGDVAARSLELVIPSRLEKHTNVPSATESRRSSVPLGMSTVAHQPTPAMGEGRNSVGKSGWMVGPSAGRPHVRGRSPERRPNFSVTSPKMSKLGGLRVVSSRIVNPQRGNEPRVKKTYPASILHAAS